MSDILFTYVLGKTSSAKSLDLQYSDFRICVELPIKAKLNSLNYTSIPSKERRELVVKKSKCFKRWFYDFNSNLIIFLKEYLDNKSKIKVKIISKYV